MYISRLNQHHHGWKDTSRRAVMDQKSVKIALSEALNWLLLSSKWLVTIHWRAKSTTYFSQIESVHETATKIHVDRILNTLFHHIYLLN